MEVTLINNLTTLSQIPADCLVIEAAEMTADESAMTGETDPLKKKYLAFFNIFALQGSSDAFTNM